MAFLEPCTQPASLGAIVVFCLATLLPGRSPGSVSEAPVVDPSRLKHTSEGVVAPVLGSASVARLTVDPELQRVAEHLLAQASPVDGALVAIEARSGRTLVLSDYSRRESTERPSPLVRQVPAASIFKIVTAAALLGRLVSPKLRVCIRGGDHEIRAEHLLPAKGAEARCGLFRSALGYSRNAVFAQLATRFLTPSTIRTVAERLGFNGKAAFDVPVDVGTVTIPEGRLAFAQAAAGFHDSTLSPIGAAQLAYTIALRGRIARMRLVDRAADYEAPRRREVVGRALHEGVAMELRRMMEITITSGTSRSAFTDEEEQSYLGSIRAAGKTGTLRSTDRDVTTSWFIGFAPSRHPKIVVSVMLDNGRIWRRKANEVGRDLLRAYFAERGSRGVRAP